MSLTAEREAELERSRESVRNDWRIATECGQPPTEAERVWEMVGVEMRFHCPDFTRGQSIAYHAREWVITRNPFHVDAAQHLCDLSGISPPPALAALVSEVARIRLSGSKLKGTPDKIYREAAKDYALNLMTCMCAAGLTIRQASIKAAAQLQNPVFRASYTPSSLDKFYTKSCREIELKRRRYWSSTVEGAAQLAEWQRIIPNLPDTPVNLRGERR